ncbi:hypothetical protein D3C81_2342070 [compost metagenome]
MSKVRGNWLKASNRVCPSTTFSRISVTIAASFLSSDCFEMAFSALSSGSAALTSVDS